MPPTSPRFSFEVLVPASSAIVVNLNNSSPGVGGVGCTVTVSSDQLFTELPVSLQQFDVD